MNKKQSLKIDLWQYVRGWSGGEALYHHIALTDGDTQISAIDGIFNSAKMQVATKFLIDGKKCNFSYYHFRFRGNEKDKEFFKVAKILSARKWRIWKNALEIFKSTKDKDKVLEHLQTEAVAVKLSQ